MKIFRFFLVLWLGIAIGMSFTPPACAQEMPTTIAYGNLNGGGKIILLLNACEIQGRQYVVFNVDNDIVQAGCWTREGNVIFARSNGGRAYKWSLKSFKAMGQ